MIAHHRAADKASRRPAAPVPGPGDHLRDLAGYVDRVSRLGRDARNGPESFVIEKLSLAAELRVLARGLGQ